VSDRYIVWYETSTVPQGTPADTAGIRLNEVLAYDRRNGKISTVLRSGDAGLGYALDGSRLVWAGQGGVQVIDLNSGKSTTLSERAGIEPSIKGNTVVWTAASSEGSETGLYGSDIWYADLTKPNPLAQPLIADSGNQRSAAVSGDVLIFQDEYPVQSNTPNQQAQPQNGPSSDKRYGEIVRASLQKAMSGQRPQRKAPKSKGASESTLSMMLISDVASATATPTATPTAPMPPAMKGIHGANDFGWERNAAAFDVLINQTTGIPYFGSIVVLSNDLHRPIHPTYAPLYTWLGVTAGSSITVGDAMRYLSEEKGVRVIVRFFDGEGASPAATPDPKHIPDAQGGMSPGIVVQHVKNFLDKPESSWIKVMQIDNEPNIEWPWVCRGCYWTSPGNQRHTYTWTNCPKQSDTDCIDNDRKPRDPQFYQAIADFYKEVAVGLGTYKNVEFWPPPMAPTYIILYEYGNEYQYLEAMVNAYGPRAATRFSYHAYPYPGGDSVFGKGIRNDTFDWFPTAFQCRVDSTAWFFCPDELGQQPGGDIRSQISEMGWNTDRMREVTWLPGKADWGPGCGHNQVDNFWPAIQPDMTPTPSGTPFKHQGACDGWDYPAQMRSPEGDPAVPIGHKEHSFSKTDGSGDLQMFIRWFRHGAETVNVWRITGGNSPNDDAFALAHADGINGAGQRREWFTNYQEWRP
jgi:hypothetical protein